jgi:hypothetical protein
MGKFTPVKPEDFWYDPMPGGISDPWGFVFIPWTTGDYGKSTILGLYADKIMYADALRNQILLHRSLTEIESDQAIAAEGKRFNEKEITRLTNLKNGLYKEYPDLDTGLGPVYDDLRAQRNDLNEKIELARNQAKKQYAPWMQFLKEEYAAEVARQKKNGTYKPKTPNKRNGKAVSQAIQVNVGAVKEAYFSSKDSFTALATVSGTNTPPAVTKAIDLWKTSGGHKGMIQTWDEIGANQTFTDTENQSAKITLKNYGFQFLYNPASINMGYSGIPDVDITMYTSGKAATNLWAPNSFQSQITFDLVLNRMFDLKYYDKDGKKIDSRYRPENLYVGRIPSRTDQELISEKGTMYDLEYLLSTTIGFKQPTKWRGETADLGWVSAMPVELHLGKSLRYLVVISGINVNHVIFDERMVPIFSVIRLTCQRIPDYPTTSEQLAQNYSDVKASKGKEEGWQFGSSLTADSERWDISRALRN